MSRLLTTLDAAGVLLWGREGQEHDGQYSAQLVLLRPLIYGVSDA